MLTICALALVTGFVLAETRLVALTPIVTHGSSPHLVANTALVRSFFSLVNDALRTGDAAPLAKLFAPDYETRADWLGGELPREDFGESLRSLHAIFPGLQLTIRDLLAQDDRVVAWITTEEPQTGSFLGLPVSGIMDLDGVHLFRLKDGRILEYQHEAVSRTRFESLLSAPVTLTGPPRKMWTLARRTYPPGGSSREVVDAGPTLLWVEGGELAVEIDPGSVASARLWSAASDRTTRDLAPGSPALTAPGFAVAASPPSILTTRNDSPSAVTVLAVTFTGIPNGLETGSWNAMAAVEAAGIGQEFLAGGSAVTLPTGSITLGLGRATFGSTTELPIHRVSGGELIAVEAGTMELSVDAGATSATTATRQSVGAGEGIVVGSDSVVGYRNAGIDSLTIFVVTLSPTTHAKDGLP